MLKLGEEHKELVFSESFACPYCEFSLPELEPRIFSFNAPYGACPDCKGLGMKLQIDENLIIPDESKSLEETSKEFNLTRERIRQIEAKALRKLRHPSRSKKLKDYLE